MFTSSLQPYADLDKQESIQCSAQSKIDFPCFAHMITLEEYLLRSYEAFCLRELIVETKKLPNKKVVQFDNVWFVTDTSPWSCLKAKNIAAKEVQLWIILMIAKTFGRMCVFQLETSHKPALMKKQPMLEEDAIKDNEDTLKRREHDSNFLNLTSSPLLSHEPCIEDIQEWFDKYGVKVKIQVAHNLILYQQLKKSMMILLTIMMVIP